MISNNVEASEKPLNAANSADFRRIYNETMILLFKVSWRIVNDEDAAEDIVSDSIINHSEKKMSYHIMN